MNIIVIFCLISFSAFAYQPRLAKQFSERMYEKKQKMNSEAREDQGLKHSSDSNLTDRKISGEEVKSKRTHDKK